MNNEPIFLTGVQRSGTTLLAAMLAAHSRLNCGPETHFFSRLAQSDPDKLIAPATWPDEAVRFVTSISHTNFSQGSDERVPLLEKHGLTSAQIAGYLKEQIPCTAAILNAIEDPCMLRAGKQRWVEKTPDHTLQLDLIRQTFPSSPVIRILRDPRDVAISLTKVPWGAKSFLEGLGPWKRLDEASFTFFEHDQNCYGLSYEDLIRDPDGELQKLCAFLGEEFEPAMLDTSTSGKLVNSRDVPWKTKAARPVDANRASAWQKALSPAQNKLAEAYLGDRLDAYGFERSEKLPGYVEIFPPGASLLAYEGSLYTVVTQGLRFWRASAGEQASARLYLGDPAREGWLKGSAARRALTAARLSAGILSRGITSRRQFWAPGRVEAGQNGFFTQVIKSLLSPYRVIEER